MINLVTTFILHNNGTSQLISIASYERDLSFQHFLFLKKWCNIKHLKECTIFSYFTA